MDANAYAALTAGVTRVERGNADVAASTRDLIERRTNGRLSHERIVWAARLGDAAALGAVGGVLDEDHGDTRIVWAHWWDRRHALRSVAEAVARDTRAPWRLVNALAAVAYAERAPRITDDGRAVCAAVRAWIADPTPARLGAVKQARARLRWQDDAAAAYAAAAYAAAAGAAAAAYAQAREHDWQRRYLIRLALGEEPLPARRKA